MREECSFCECLLLRSNKVSHFHLPEDAPYKEGIDWMLSNKVSHFHIPEDAPYREGIDWMEGVIKEENISCDWRRVSTFVFPESPLDGFDSLEKELLVGFPPPPPSHHSRLTIPEFPGFLSTVLSGGVARWP